MRAAAVALVMLVGCSGPSGPEGERGPQGDPGAPGTMGTMGSAGTPGSAGPSGTTGQDVFEAYGTGQLQVASSSTFFALVPGLALTVNVPAGAKVRVETNGGLQCTLAGNAFSAVDVALFVDGAVSTQGGQRRVIAANTATVGQMVATWSFGRSYNLGQGSHTFEVRAASGDTTGAGAVANVSSATAPQIQGVLTVTIIRQ